MQHIAFNTNNAALQPNTTTYNLVIACYTNQQNDKSSAICVEKLLKEIEYQTRTTALSNNDIKPDLTSFNTVMKAWANSRCIGVGDTYSYSFFWRLFHLHFAYSIPIDKKEKK